MRRRSINWLFISLMLIWQVLLLPRLVGELMSFPGEARAALYPTAELASIVVEAAGVYITGGIWLLGTMLLVLAIVLTRPRSTRSPS